MTDTDLFQGVAQFMNANSQAPVIEQKEEVKEEKKEEIGFTLEELENVNKTPKEGDIIAEIKNSGLEPEKVESKKETTEQVEEPTNNTEVFKAVSELFKSEGLIENTFESAEEMVDVFSKVIKAEVDDYKESLHPTLKELIKNFEEGVPLEDLITHKSAQVRYSNIEDSTLEKDELLQKNLMKDYLSKTTKYSTEKINKELKRLEDLGELLDEAKTAKTELIEFEKEQEKKIIEQTKADREKAEKENAKIVKDIHKTIVSTKEIIPGIKLTEKETDKLFKMVTTPAEVRGNQPISTASLMREKDPIKFDMTLNYLIELGVFDGKWDKIMTKAETKTVSKLEKQVEEAAQKLINKGGSSAGIPGNKGEEIMKGLSSILKK
jgi:hypothetical protein